MLGVVGSGESGASRFVGDFLSEELIVLCSTLLEFLELL